MIQCVSAKGDTRTFVSPEGVFKWEFFNVLEFLCHFWPFVAENGRADNFSPFMTVVRSSVLKPKFPFVVIFASGAIVGTLFCVYRHACVLGTGVKKMVWLDVAF